MKTAVICISDVYLERGRALAHFYQSIGDEVIILTPEFSHRTKQPVRFEDPLIAALPHRPYRRNLSYDRLKGHSDFARTVRHYLEAWKPERIHCMIPANSLARQMDLYKKSEPKVQLILDINDLWPESLPAHGLQKLPLLRPWKNLRDLHMNSADLVLCECDLFAKHLQPVRSDLKVLYWSGPEPLPQAPQAPETVEPLCLAYLGSMNHILDIDLIDRLLEKLAASRALVVHLIGDGENAQRLQQTCAKHAEVFFHGPVFDDDAKRDIFSRCHFGLNLLREEVQIGLSLKSLEYMRFGLPLLSTLGGDTSALIEQEGIGLQIDRKNPDTAVQRLLDLKPERIAVMKLAAWQTYGRLFTPQAMARRLTDLLEGSHLLSAAERASLAQKGDWNEHSS